MAEDILDIRIRPGIEPRARHLIEDAIESAGYEIEGGGGFVDGSESDIIVLAADLTSALPVVRRILQQARVGRESVIKLGESGDQEQPVYRDSDPLPDDLPPESGSSGPWWKFWSR